MDPPERDGGGGARGDGPPATGGGPSASAGGGARGDGPPASGGGPSASAGGGARGDGPPASGGGPAGGSARARTGAGSRRAPGNGPAAPARPVISPPRYGRYVGVLAIVILILITINTILTKPNGSTGIAPGTTVPPFAAPLATGTLAGDVDVATHADDGSAGKVAACRERGPQILNICELYEQGPVVLALFVDSGSCPAVLGDMQTLSGEFPQVRFAAVAIKGGTGGVRKLIRSHGLSFPVGLDRDGILAALYKVASCPQLSFVERGGTVQSRALLSRVPLASLRARVAALARTETQR